MQTPPGQLGGRRHSETGRFPRIPVVIFSVYVDASTAATHGCSYLPKPYGAAQVGDTLRAALEHDHHG